MPNGSRRSYCAWPSRTTASSCVAKNGPLENIERYCLEPYGMKLLESGNYALSIPYRNDEALDKTVHDLLTEISQEAEMRNCFIEADAWEEGSERRW